MIEKNIIRAILILLLLGTFYIIFGFSSQEGKKSGSLSKQITNIVITNIPQINQKPENEKKEIMARTEKVIRKLAHFSIYTVLGILIMGIMETYSLNDKKRIAISLAAGILYASSDEIHQSFVPERTAQITDVMIDSMGVLLGILIIMLGVEIVRKIKLKSDIKQQKLIKRG